MGILVTGSTGLVGQQFLRLLGQKSEKAVPLVRDREETGAVAWDPHTGVVLRGSLEGFDAVVHLAAENISEGRWTEAKKKRILESRSIGTRRLAEALARLKNPPKVLVSASAVGFYGDRGDEILDENAVGGSGFLADVCREWEAATAPASAAGIRVCNVRLGAVLDASRGMLGKLRVPFSLGLGGIVGTGAQWLSWISVQDAVAAIHHAIRTPALSGPVNLTSPNAVTNAEFTATLARILHRPAIFRLPRRLAQAAFGDLADELLLSSTRVRPEALLSTGFRFGYSELVPALQAILAK